ncbi:UvrY/SirA/GacA family response regulator transcription factor [Ravibacter arvi]|uniref:UvrY/SirA/GacA family response regulator transcription factor n=1 Tax=Ravibacter arvi TaxID=2051041 RepID=A0ABP8M5S1_9BACT
MKQILIVDDHFLTSLGLELLIKKVIKKCSVCMAGNFEAAMRKLKDQRFDVMLLDLGIPGGHASEMIQTFLKVQPGLRILVCSGRDELANAPGCIHAGAYGFLPKHAPDTEAQMAIEMVAQGKKYISNAVQAKIVNDFMYGQNSSLNPIETLSPREKEVMDLMLKGCTSKQICGTLRIKFSTVSSHKNRVFQKMAVENSIELFKKVGQYSDEVLTREGQR